MLIPAILFITKPKIHSIDKKGRATMEIELLLDRKKRKKSLVISSSYKKYKEDQIILVKGESVKDRILTMDQTVGSANDMKSWDIILPYRIQVPPRRSKHVAFQPELVGENGLKEMNHYICHGGPYSFLCVDSPGTVDREDGVWYHNVSSMGVFVVDIPSQFKWNHNMKSCVTYLSEMWQAQIQRVKTTRTFYLPTGRLPLFQEESYRTIQEINKNLPILCYDIIKQTMFPYTIQSHHEVHLLTTEDKEESYPSWWKCSPMADWSVADCNTYLNRFWTSVTPNVKQRYICQQTHPTYTSYHPFSSPIRDICCLWNQCVWWDSIGDAKKYSLHIHQLYHQLQVLSLHDRFKSKLIRSHINSVQFVTLILEQNRSDWEGIVDYKVHPESDGFIRIKDTAIQIWCPKQILKGKKIGDTVKIQCRIRKTKDPLFMIRLKPHQTESSTKDTTTES